jgi:hypothetical protein
MQAQPEQSCIFEIGSLRDLLRRMARAGLASALANSYPTVLHFAILSFSQLLARVSAHEC